MKWWMQASAELALAYLPGGRWAHARLRERSGELSKLEESTRFDNALYFVRMARQFCGELGDIRAVEFGTGWVPAVPLAFMTCGAHVETYDVSRLVTPESFRRTHTVVRGRAPEFAAAADLPLQAVEKRHLQIQDAPDFAVACRRLGGCYRAPYDTCNLPYRDGEADLVYSNLVLQCVPQEILQNLIRESARVLRPGGFAIHRIRTTDEVATRDPRRNHLEFLKYSRKTWERWFCHPIRYLNRLRASQLIEVFCNAGFDCRAIERDIDYDSIPVLERLSLAPEFRGLELEDLATINLDIVLQKPLRKPAAGLSTRVPSRHETPHNPM